MCAACTGAKPSGASDARECRFISVCLCQWAVPGCWPVLTSAAQIPCCGAVARRQVALSMQLAQLHMCLHIFKHVDHLSGPGKGWENTKTTGERQHPVRGVERCEAGVGSYQAGSQRRARLRRHHQGAEQQQARRDEVGKNAKNTRAAAVRGTAGPPHGRLTRASWQMQKEFRREAWRGIWRVLGRGGWEGPALGYHQLQSFISQRLTRGGGGIDGA